MAPVGDGDGEREKEDEMLAEFQNMVNEEKKRGGSSGYNEKGTEYEINKQLIFHDQINTDKDEKETI